MVSSFNCRSREEDLLSGRFLPGLDRALVELLISSEEDLRFASVFGLLLRVTSSRSLLVGPFCAGLCATFIISDLRVGVLGFWGAIRN